jgi:hypothetical protein
MTALPRYSQWGNMRPVPMTTTSNDFDIGRIAGKLAPIFLTMKKGPSRSSCVGGLGETVAPIEQGSGVATVTSLCRDWSGLQR